MERRTVRINVGRGYDAIIGGGLLEECGGLIAGVTGVCRAAVITDSNVEKLYLARVIASLEKSGIRAESFVFTAGEGSKNISTLGSILEFLAERRFVRSDVIVALGGGVTGDMAGFAAAVYLRGIRYVQLPTTLLAAVDSSVGGKTAIDLAAGKNMAGAFKQPEIVVCDTDTLATLPYEEFTCGIAEALKYGVLFSRGMFDSFAGEMDNARLTSIIADSIAYKGRVVEHDEFDTGERRLLNLGHTIGHAIENCSGYTMRHGHAVAAGMAMIARAGEAMGQTEPGTAAEICGMLERYSLPTGSEYSCEELTNAALADKKRLGGGITLVVPERIGSCVLKTEPVEKLGRYIELGKGM